MTTNNQQSPPNRSHPVRRDLLRSPLRLSPTSVALYQQCPQQYKFRYIQKLGDQYQTAKPYLTMANHVHATLKELLSLQETDPPSPARARQLLEAQWRNSSIGFKDAENERQWFDKAWRQVESFALSPYVKAAPIMLETPIEALVSPGVMLYGRVDRVDRRPDGSVHIIDYKTGRPPVEIRWEQLQLQALILSVAKTASVGCISFLYLDGSQMVTRDFNSAVLDQTRWDLLGIANKMRLDKHHPPRAGDRCKYCDFGSICSASIKESPERPATQLALGEDLFNDVRE